MNKLYYGNGICSIEGSEILIITLRYRGAIEIDDKTPDGFFIMEANDLIKILPIKNVSVGLNNLFEYVGEFKILQATAISRKGERLQVAIRQIVDYSELINTNAEDLTTFSENLKTNTIRGKRIKKTILKQRYIENLITKDHMNMVNSEGLGYSGYYHYDLVNKIFMTGATNTSASVKISATTDLPVVKSISKKRHRKNKKDISRRGLPKEAMLKLIEKMNEKRKK